MSRPAPLDSFALLRMTVHDSGQNKSHNFSAKLKECLPLPHNLKKNRGASGGPYPLPVQSCSGYFPAVIVFEAALAISAFGCGAAKLNTKPSDPISKEVT